MAATDSGGVSLAGSPGTSEGLQSNATTSSDEVTYISPVSRKLLKKTKLIDEDEPLIDTTVALPKRSKKTDRAAKRLERKNQKEIARPKATSLLDLPTELLQHILSFLRPSDVFRFQRTAHALHDFVEDHENAIARDVIHRRYWVLSRCFQLPVPLKDVDPAAYPALLSQRRQDVLTTHRRPYQHVKSSDPQKACTCLHCVLSWNNLCLILDLAHWQKNLDEREPIPMISRGTSPEWNQRLIERNAAIVENAMFGHLLYYATILEKHLKTTMSTLSRTFRGKKTVHPKRLYHFTNADAEKETDEFLERSGPHSVRIVQLRYRQTLSNAPFSTSSHITVTTTMLWKLTCRIESGRRRMRSGYTTLATFTNEI